MIKKPFLFLILFFVMLGISSFGLTFAHAQTTSALQAEQAATANYLKSPTVTNKNILLSAMNNVSTQASAPGNTTSANAQSIQQAANSAYNNTPAPASTVNSVNPTTESSVVSTSAQTASVVAKGGSCAPTSNNGPELSCASGLECDNNGICNPTPKSGSVGTGGWCGSNDTACLSGLSCNSSGMCVTATQTATPTASTPASQTFVPLTNIPILFNAVNAPTLPLFLNAIYKYMIGIAATLAVIEIMIAGVQYMGGGSVSETKDARNRIQNAVLGLVIVLAPAIVFGLINPKILNLDLGSDFNSLNTTTTAAPAATTPAASTQSQLPSYGTGAIPVVPISNAGSVPAQDTSVNAPTTVPFAPTGDTSTAYPGTEGTPITPANYGSQ
jgi:type IV secretory pathway VirB2 component (pilin)